ncbi:MAG TPA: hypothetical protein VH185_07455 [Mycobacterium sp.]|nr:hypothetical protein [Mycobacterium sp.]
MVMEANRAESVEPPATPAAEVLERLRVTRPGLNFREVMKGLITMGATDPVKGYADDAAIAMELHAAVRIPNLPGFLKDPTHKGRWQASGSIPVLHGDITSEDDGDFGLFRRAIRKNRGVRELVYDTEISVGDQRYRMRGRKFVEPSPPWRMWPATTTLYVQFFPVTGGTDDPAGAVAAGVLRLSLGAFIKQLLSMRVTGRFGLIDKFGHLLTFYRFFVSSLVNTYIKGRRW